eukprot:1356417-Pyramimonas_sp.AAC.1
MTTTRGTPSSSSPPRCDAEGVSGFSPAAMRPRLATDSIRETACKRGALSALSAKLTHSTLLYSRHSRGLYYEPSDAVGAHAEGRPPRPGDTLYQPRLIRSSWSPLGRGGRPYAFAPAAIPNGADGPVLRRAH